MSASHASESCPPGRPSEGDDHESRGTDRSVRSGASARGEGVVPDDALPCVWMTAGLIAWRLCDREYDCEHCELDAALGGEHSAAGRPLERAPRRTRLEFPRGRRYSASHGWVQEREDARLRLGSDALVGRLLDRLSSAVLPAVGSHTRRGQPLCWLVDDSVPIPLASPVTGTVVRVNPKIRADPTLILRSPYGEGWLLELAAEPGLLQRRKDLKGPAEQREVTARQLRDLRRRGTRLEERSRPSVGPTLCDGGLRARGMRRRLGVRDYHRLVSRLLG